MQERLQGLLEVYQQQMEKCGPTAKWEWVPCDTEHGKGCGAQHLPNLDQLILVKPAFINPCPETYWNKEN